MEFLSLEKGDKNNLEGKVIVYSKCNFPTQRLNELKDSGLFKILEEIDYEKSQDMLKHLQESVSEFESKNVIAMYATQDITDIKERFSEFLPSDLEEQIKRASQSPPKPNVKIENYYCVPYIISVEDLNNLDKFKEDIINLGAPLSLEGHHKASIAAIQLYMAFYREQRQRRSKSSSLQNQKNKENNKETQEHIILYNELKEKNQKLDYLNSHYFSPILYKLESNNINGAIDLSQEFIVFSQDSVIEDDAYAVASIVNLNQPEHAKYRPELLNNYFTKITAIAREDYKQAAVCRDKINSIKACIKRGKS